MPGADEDEEETTDVLPFASAFRGLARAEAEALDDADLKAALRLSLSDGMLGVVAADRPADVVAVLGWHGAVNSGHDSVFAAGKGDGLRQAVGFPPQAITVTVAEPWL